MSNTFDKKSSYDPGQISRMGFDDNLRAHRMVLINPPGQFTVPVSEVAQPIINNTVVERVEVPVVIKEIEYKEVQVPVIVKEVQIVEIEKPVYIEKIVHVEVEKPIFQQIESSKYQEMVHTGLEVKIIEKDLPKWVKIALAAQFITSLIMLLKK